MRSAIVKIAPQIVAVEPASYITVIGVVFSGVKDPGMYGLKYAHVPNWDGELAIGTQVTIDESDDPERDHAEFIYVTTNKPAAVTPANDDWLWLEDFQALAQTVGLTKSMGSQIFGTLLRYTEDTDRLEHQGRWTRLADGAIGKHSLRAHFQERSFEQFRHTHTVGDGKVAGLREILDHLDALAA